MGTICYCEDKYTTLTGTGYRSDYGYAFIDDMRAREDDDAQRCCYRYRQGRMGDLVTESGSDAVTTPPTL